MSASAHAAERDREAEFAMLIERGLDRSYRLASLILRDAAEAEDATQDAVVTAWSRWHQLRDPLKFDAWFTRILVNRCRDRLRRGHRTSTVDLSAVLARESGDQRRADDRIDIGRAFEALNADQRVAIVLRFWADLSVDEIAVRTGSPSGTVKSRLHHALARLRAELERDR